MPSKTAPTFITVKDASIRYGVSVPTIWRWVQEDKFPRPVKLGSRTTRWHVSALEIWEQERFHVA